MSHTKTTPLGGPVDTDLKSIQEYIERKLEAPTNDLISFYKISNEVFLR